MTVTLTSPALGKDVGQTHTGPEEDYLLAQGLARRDGYTGPGVSNTGPSAQTPAEDLQLAANREPAPKKYLVATNGQPAGGQDPGPLDPAMVLPGDPSTEEQGEDYDFDEGSVNDDAPTVESVDPASLPLAGRASVKIYGQNFEGATGGTVGGTALTAFVVNSDTEITATFPAKTAGSYAVAVTNPTGTGTEAAAVTYAA